jgi:REP element-mobilizing transposase RayT
VAAQLREKVGAALRGSPTGLRGGPTSLNSVGEHTMATPSNKPRRKAHRLAPAAYARADHSYFFTICARHHGSPFTNVSVASEVVAAIKWTRERYKWAVYAYCLMPDHLHFLCRPMIPIQGVVNGGGRGMQPESVLDHVARFKSFTTQRAWAFGVAGELWQRSSYDAITDGSRPTEEIARYILANPLRKGLVEDWTEWPFSGILDAW